VPKVMICVGWYIYFYHVVRFLCGSYIWFSTAQFLKIVGTKINLHTWLNRYLGPVSGSQIKFGFGPKISARLQLWAILYSYVGIEILTKQRMQ